MTTMNVSQIGQGVVRMTVKRACGDIILLYRLCREAVTEENGHRADVFSLSVTKVDCGGTRREVQHLTDIARTRGEADRIFELVSRGLVTPCTVYEIVSELICV